MVGVVHLEVHIAVQVVLQEAAGALQGHGVGTHGQGLNLGLGQVGGGLQEAAGVDLEQVQVHLHLGQVLLVLGGGGGTEADGVTEIEGTQAGHDGVQVQDAQALAGLLVQQNVVQLGIVVGDAQGQAAVLTLLLEPGAHLLALQDEVHLGLDTGQTAHGVGGNRLLELAIAVGGVVEFGDGLGQGLGGELAEHLLEAAEGQGGLVEVVLALGGVQAEAADEVVHAPELALGVLVVELAVLGGQEVQGQTGVIHPGPDVVGDGTGVVHEAHRVLEHIGIDALEDILRALVRFDLKGGIDVAVAEGDTADGLALKAESVNSVFHLNQFFSFCCKNSETPPEQVSGRIPERAQFCILL